jgi:hypothetical protein
MKTTAIVCICIIALARCLILHSLNPYFDLHPLVTGELSTGVLGPGTSVLLDAIVLACCSVALLGEVIQGRKLHSGLLCLVLLPIILIWYQGRIDPMQFVHGSSWLAALLACVTLAHVGREKATSILVGSLFLLLTFPLLIHAALAYGEHTQIVQYFEQNTADVLAMNGIQAQTPAAAVFEERIRSYGPMGWFSTPNVFGSILVSLGVVWIFVSFYFRDTKRTIHLLSAIVAFLCFIAASSTMSKAVVVLVVFSLGIGWCVVHPKTSTFFKRYGGWTAITLMLGTTYAVFIRGYLDETILSERSLLVRKEYFVGGLEIALKNLFLGVGPSNIQDAWLSVRPETATEAIKSTHNIAIDWFAAYGLLAVCWMIVLFNMVWRTGTRLFVSDVSNKQTLRAAGFSIAAIVLIVDAQIDLPMFDLGSTLFVFCMLGLASSLPTNTVRCSPVHLVVAMVPFLAALLIVSAGYAPLAHDESLQKTAAIELIAGEPPEVVATKLSKESVTTPSKIIAAKLFVTAEQNDKAHEALSSVVPSASVWSLRARSAPTTRDALHASKQLILIDQNGLTSPLIHADLLWQSDDTTGAKQYYQLVLSRNEVYKEVDRTRALSEAEVTRITDRVETP